MTRARSVYGFVLATWFTPFLKRLRLRGRGRLASGEDRNRTCPGSCEPTTVLKTARATRHPPLSGEKKKKTSNAQRSTSNVELQKKKMRDDYLSFLIWLTTWSKSGQSPESSLEWSSLPLARISKAPPPEGMSVSDLMRSPSSRILVAKLTAFGV